MLMIISIANIAYAGETAQKVGQVVGKAAKETKEAGEIIIDTTKKGAKKIYSEAKEGITDFKKGVKDGYHNGADKKDSGKASN